MLRKTNFQNLAFFHDLNSRSLLDLNPAYQRRSIWSQRFKDFFIDTVINNFPCPAIFLFEQISTQGTATYHVVDGKQRLLTCFEFIENQFPVYEDAKITALRGKYFQDFSDGQKLDFWRYQFAIEFVPQEDESLITEIFDRINRNVARLTRQELRHAKYDGEFIQAVETAAETMSEILPDRFPTMASKSKRQMKDLELVGSLLLLIEVGVKSYSQDQLDAAYSERDEDWAEREIVGKSFISSIVYISNILKCDSSGTLVRSRLKNQADFYSLVGAVHDLLKSAKKVDEKIAADNLLSFLAIIENPDKRQKFSFAKDYYAASRSASNDQGPRQTRIDVLRKVICEEVDLFPESIDDSAET